MVYAFSHAQAVALAKAGLASLRTHHVPPTPPNFAVWFEYHSGATPDLTRAIDTMVATGLPLTEAMHADLYDRYFSSRVELQAFRETSLRLQDTLKEVMKVVGDAAGGAKSYGSALRDISGEIVANPKSLGDLIARLLDETKVMEQHNEVLEGRLQASTEVIESLRHNLDDIRRDALTDPLTGIANRKLFEMTLDEAASHAADSGEELSLLIVDVDHFKLFNDNWGHQIGDEVLKLIARTLKDNVKGQDLAARYGGEEFAVVLPNATLAAAVTVGNNIRHAFARRDITIKSTGQSVGRITVSIGAACLGSGEPITDLIRRADSALYRAKGGGRNRVMADSL